MKRREFLKTGLEGVVLANILPTLSADEHSIKSEVNSNSIIKDGMEYYMQTDKSTYNLGENVEMLYRWTNVGSDPVILKFLQETPCGFIVERDGLVIWLSYAFYDPTEGGPVYWLGPSEFREYTEIWLGVPDVGTYDVTGVLMGPQIGENINVRVPVSVNINISAETYVNEEKQPTEFSLQNYPNPFNSSTLIKYQLPENTKVSLDVYNISGQKIKTLVDKIQKSGLYQVKFDANNLSSGIYFYQLRTEDGIKTEKMMLVK